MTRWMPRGRADRSTWQAVRHLVPDSGDVDLLVEAVGAHRKRRIKVLECELGEMNPSALWAQTADTDYIFCPSGAAAEHRRVMVCHELAHMLLGHEPATGEVDLSGVAPSIAPAVIAGFFARHGYEDEVEAETELLATQLATELARRDAAGRAAMIITGDTISARLR